MGNTYKRSTVRASYAKDEEKKYNDRAIGAGFTQYGFGNAGTGTTANGITSVGFLELASPPLLEYKSLELNWRDMKQSEQSQ